MTPQEFLDEFGTLAESAEGVPKLRELILELAVRGKLVEQDEAEGSAQELAARVEAARQELIESKAVKKPRGEKPLDESILPFEIPATWAWIKFERLVRKMGAGSTPLGGKKVYVDDGVMFLRSQNVWSAGLRLDDVARILPGATLGKVCVAPDFVDDWRMTGHILRARLSTEVILPELLVMFLWGAKAVKTQVTGGIRGMTRPGFNTSLLERVLLPIPPLSEQKRIVSKVTHLLSLLTRLESTLTRRESTRTQLLTAAIHSMLRGNGQK